MSSFDSKRHFRQQSTHHAPSQNKKNKPTLGLRHDVFQARVNNEAGVLVYLKGQFGNSLFSKELDMDWCTQLKALKTARHMISLLGKLALLLGHCDLPLFFLPLIFY
jgi:hypothetical protein